MEEIVGTLRILAVLGTLVVLGPAHIGHAQDAGKCKAAIEKEFGKFVKTKTKILQKCNEIPVKAGTGQNAPGGNPSACDPVGKIAAAITGFHGKVNGTCSAKGVTPSMVGWPSTCPNFEGGACTNAIATSDDIAQCLACIGEEAIDQAIDLYYGSLANPGADKNLIKCQMAIGKATSKFLLAKAALLGKCRAAVDKNTHPLPCPDGPAAAAIQAAESKKAAGICKACGGADKVCGGADGFSVATIGFPPDCPAVTIPGGSACGGPITSLQDLVDCVDCVTEFKVDCLDRLSVPHQVSYPVECSGPQVVCGNGVVEAGEQCDDGNDDNTDACANCQNAFCGDGFVRQGVEQCDDGNSTPNDGCTNCTVDPPVCGNGRVEAGETCDDGNTLNGDSCPANCVILPCNPAVATRNVDVSFAGASNVAAISVYLEYPEDKISIPGSGTDQSVSDRISNTPASSLPQSNDLDYALLQGIIKTSPIPVGRIFTVTFDDCTGAQAPTVAELPCTVLDAVDKFGAHVNGVVCSATLP